MPVRTAIWSSGAVPDCKSVQLVQAMPWANGPDRYGTSHCADGDSITAITADGMQLWRRSLGASGATPPTPDSKHAVETSRINLDSTSIGESVFV